MTHDVRTIAGPTRAVFGRPGVTRAAMTGVGALIALAVSTAAFGPGALPFAASFAVAAPLQSEPSAPIARRVVSVGMTVADLDASLAFYTGVLPFEKIAESEEAGDAVERLTGVFGVRRRSATLQLGSERLVLTQYLAPEGRPIPADSRSNDLWFQHVAIVVSDMDKAYAHLRAHRVRHASTGPQTLPPSLPNAAGISAFYFKDPDGHALEVIHFPPDKGDPRWQAPTDRLFLGIDHTAIAVGDTERSLTFYRDTLGMSVAGGSENFGAEQEHLNNVFGARLRITTLRARGGGPGVELLEYLAPTTGRPAPADSKANDLWHWHTDIEADPRDAERIAARAPRSASPNAAPLGDGHEASIRVRTIRDPDGHAIVLGN